MSILINVAGWMLAFVSFVAVTGCNKKTERNGNRPISSPFVVEVVTLQSKPFRGTLFATGNLRANESVALQAERAGIVTRIHFKEGDVVKAGEVLLEIDDSELQAQLRRAQAQLELAMATEKRDRELLESGSLVSRAQYDQSRATLHIAQAELELIKAQLNKTRIVAPFDGVAGLRHVSPGAYLTPGVIVASLRDIHFLKLDFTLPERYLPQLRHAQVVSFRVAGFGETLTAKIDAIEPAVNEATRSLTVRATVENENERLLPGSFAEVEVAVEEIPNAILIPAIALVPGLKDQKVFLHKDGQVEERKVRVGLRTAEAVQINEGLQPGEELIVTGILQLRPKMKVQVKRVPDEIQQSAHSIPPTNHPSQGAGR